MLELQDVCFRYDHRSPLVLDHVDLRLEDGEIGILLGRNGAGKTTLFNVILGIVKPESGTVLFDGDNLAEMKRREKVKCIAYVPQDIRFGDLSVFDTVLSGRTAYFGFREGKQDKEIVEEILSAMNLEHLSHRNVNELSGGERQKIAVARALAQQPKMLVFDEPTGNLDIANEQLIIEEIQHLAHEKGITVLTSIHDLNQALQFGERFFLMNRGRICYTGDSSVITEEAIRECYGADVRIFDLNHRRIILNGGI